MSGAQIRTAHTADLDGATLASARTLPADVFEGDLSDADWKHPLGGVHALAWDGDELNGHASVVLRRLPHGGRALRAGCVEAVGVRRDRRREGHGAALMAALERVPKGAYEMGALSAAGEAAELSTALGWTRWQGPSYALTPQGVVRTEDEDDGVFVLPLTGPVDVSGALTCDWRDGHVW